MSVFDLIFKNYIKLLIIPLLLSIIISFLWYSTSHRSYILHSNISISSNSDAYHTIFFENIKNFYLYDFVYKANKDIFSSAKYVPVCVGFIPVGNKIMLTVDCGGEEENISVYQSVISYIKSSSYVDTLKYIDYVNDIKDAARRLISSDIKFENIRSDKIAEFVINISRADSFHIHVGEPILIVKSLAFSFVLLFLSTFSTFFFISIFFVFFKGKNVF